MKRKIKALTDAVMYLIFVYLMSYRAGRGLFLHGVLGCTLFALFVLHHILNGRWYGALKKGNYHPLRVFLTGIDLLLFAAMIGMAVSSVMMSGDVFGFSPFITTYFARTLHSFSTAWGFVLMLFHMGLHTHAPFERLRKKADDSIFGYAYYLLFLLVMVMGIICFAKSSLWRNMLLLAKGNPPFETLRFYGEYGMITLAFCQCTHLTTRFLKKTEQSLWKRPGKSLEK